MAKSVPDSVAAMPLLVIPVNLVSRSFVSARFLRRAIPPLGKDSPGNFDLFLGMVAGEVSAQSSWIFLRAFLILELN